MEDLAYCEKTTIPEIVGFQLLNTADNKMPSWQLVPWQYRSPTRGDIGAYAADRLDSWNQFIVIEVPEFKKKFDLKVIFPRIKVVDGKLLFGQDKTIGYSDLHKIYINLKNANV